MAARVHFETVATGGGGGGSGTVTNVSALTIGTAGTNLSSTVINSTTTPVITLNVPTASAVNRGALSSADWSTFNSKQSLLVSGTNIKTVNSTSLLGSGNLAVQAILVSGTNIKTVNSTSLLGSGNLAVQEILVSGTNIKTVNGNSLLGSGNLVISGGGTPSGVAGSVQFSDGTNFASDNANFFWDDTNNRLGINTNTPTSVLQLSIPTIGTILTLNNLVTPTQIFKISKPFPSVNLFDIGTTATNFKIFDSYIRISVGSPATKFSISNNGNIGIGIQDDPAAARVHIKGSGTTSATTSLLVQNSAGVNMIQITDDITTTVGNQFNIIRTSVPSQIIELNANFSTIAAGIRAGGNAKDFVISAKDSRDLYLSTNFVSSITQVQFAVKHNIGVLIKDNASTIMDASARLEVASTTQGFLPPRMTQAQINAIVAPATGLMAFNLDIGQVCAYDGAVWHKLNQSIM